MNQANNQADNAKYDTIPAPEVMDYHGELPTAFAKLTAFASIPVEGARFDSEPEVPATPSVGTWMQPSRSPVAQNVELADLERFKALMGESHWPVHVARMLFDRQYAYDRIVLAHTSRNFELRTLALNLFKMYQARGQNH